MTIPPQLEKVAARMARRGQEAAAHRAHLAEISRGQNKRAEKRREALRERLEAEQADKKKRLNQVKGGNKTVRK